LRRRWRHARTALRDAARDRRQGASWQWVSNILSAAVLTGLSFGVAIDVAAGELFTITGTKNSGSNTWTTLWSWVEGLPQLHRATVVVGVLALVLLFGLKLLTPRLPGALITVALGIVATIAVDLHERGVSLIPAVPRGLPTPAVPDLTLIADRLPEVVVSSVSLVLIGFSVTTAAVRQYATKHNCPGRDHHRSRRHGDDERP